MKPLDNGIRIALMAALVAVTAVLGWPKRLPEVRLPPEPPKRSPRAQTGPERSTKEKSVFEPSSEEELEEPPAPPSLDGRIEQLGRRELQLPMEAIRPRLAGCKAVEHFVGSLEVRLRINRSGGVESASVLPPNEHTRTADCVRQIARTANFGRFHGTRIPVVELTYPVTFGE